MNPNGARCGLASCGTRQVRAKLLRRVHWLLMFLLHKHIMPMGVEIFKPLPPFHQLVGFYPFLGTVPLIGERAQTILRGRPGDRLGTVGSGVVALREHLGRFGSTQ